MRQFGGVSVRFLVAFGLSLASVTAVVGSSPADAIDGSISGSVTASGQPVSSVGVNVCPLAFGVCRFDFTDGQGAYSVVGLAADEYAVSFYPPPPYLPEFYDGVPSLDDATPVVVVGGADTSGIDASLEVGGSISGTLTGAGVGPLEGILVEACTVDLPIVCGYGGTVAGGTWSIEALGVGDYTVLFRPSSGFVPEFFDDALTADSATPVSVVSGSDTGSIDAELAAEPAAGAVWPDFDGDGLADRGVFRPEFGGWFVDGQVTGFLGLSGDVPVPGDYTGDGVTDRAVFRDGAWFIEGEATRFLGAAGDVPVPGDYDGDGDWEPAVFRDGVWFVEGQATRYLGSSGDVPVPGDYDGDGVTEIGVFRPSVGGWYVEGEAPVFYGLSSDVPVPADYDGDGVTDRGVFRPEFGGWYVDGQVTEFIGLSSDVPVPADYDGDGVVERGVFRPEFGGWYVQDEATVFYGLGTDIPLSLPAAVYDIYSGQGGESALAVSG